MRLALVRLATLAVGIAVVVSCDAGPTSGTFGNGISGGPTGTAPVVPPTGADTNDPFVRIDIPTAGQLINVGDSILVQVTLIDDRKVGGVSITGFKERGDTSLGTYIRTVRYPTVTAPAAGQPFQPGQTVATMRRYLKPAVPVDTTAPDSLRIVAIGTDSAGNVDSNFVYVRLITGPKVEITNPCPSAACDPAQGFGMGVSARATSGSGVSSVTINVQGEPTWPTPLNFTITQNYAGLPDVTLSANVPIPADAPIGRPVTITATALDVNGNPGLAPTLVKFIRATGSQSPLVCFAAIVNGQTVCQELPAKLEGTDKVTISATGDGITILGIVIRDDLGNLIRRDSIIYAAPFQSNKTDSIQLFPTSPIDSAGMFQGRKINVIAFAYDANTPPRVGFSVAAGTTIPVGVEASAIADTTTVTHGRTFSVPRAGTITDLAVDELRGNIFLSNTSFNLLEVWSNSSKTFATNGVAVGALPWGLFVSNNPDIMFVGNSGATTISRVCINPAACPGGVMAEDLPNRLRTRNTIIYQVQFSRDPLTDKIRIDRLPDVSYSDRPQYVAQSQGGRLFFSTRPTAANRAGTLRWLDPAFTYADPRQIWQYGSVTGGGTAYAILNVDSIGIVVAPPTSNVSDRLVLYDHLTNQLCPVPAAPPCDFTVNDSLPADAGTKNRAAGGDADVILGLVVESLALTDTTYVASSGDRSWIGFGEGNTAGTGRVMMVNDPPPGPLPGFFSPNITVRDLIDNASEKVFGIAIDRTGLQVAAHGAQTYVAAIDNPFHLRLDGVYDSFDNGAGVTYHPLANSTLSANADRVLFTATQNGVIEIVDVAHYNNRGRLTTRGNLYGPLRATLPIPGDNGGLACPGDPQCVILKIYGLSTQGLVVIDVRASDIKPGP
jgi:hypothetical protein